jgi:hypothetical protein
MDQTQHLHRANDLAKEIVHRLEVEGYALEDRMAIYNWLKEALAVAEDAKL